MGRGTVLRCSLRSPHGDAASATSASRACASRPLLDLDCIGTSGAAPASKGSKRLGSSREDEPPTKRRRAGGDAAAKNPPMSLEEKDGVNRLLLSLSSVQVNPLPDLVVRVLQENGIRCCCGGEDGETEIEIYVHALGDEALWAIKYRVGAYLDGIAQRDAALSKRKEGVIGQSAARSIPSQSFRSRAASDSIRSTAASKNIPPRPASKSTSSEAVSRCIQPRAASKSTSSEAASRSIPPRAAVNSNRPRAVPRSAPAPLRAASKSTLPKAASKRIPPKAVSLLPAPPKLSESTGSVSTSQSTPRSTPPSAPTSFSSSTEPTKSIKELLADAREAMDQIVRRRELEQLRAAARREVEQVVRTVEFNDPYIDVQDAFK